MGLAFAASLAACSGDDPRFVGDPRPFPEAGAPADDDAGPGARDGGDAGDALGDAGADADAEPPPFDAGPPLCATTLTLGATERLDVSTPGDDLLGGVTPDELTLVWTSGVAGAVTVHWADRATASAPFVGGAGVAGAFALDRVAVTEDGLGVVAIAEGGRTFVKLARAARGEAFVETTTFEFANLEASLGDGERFSDPVLARGDLVLVHSRVGPSVVSPVRLATRLQQGSAFDAAAVLEMPELRAVGDARRRPTGVSADFRTLFFRDGVDGAAKAGFFAGTVAFERVVSLGARDGVVPNAACTALFFSAAASSLDLFRAPLL